MRNKNVLFMALIAITAGLLLFTGSTIWNNQTLATSNNPAIDTNMGAGLLFLTGIAVTMLGLVMTAILVVKHVLHKLR